MVFVLVCLFKVIFGLVCVPLFAVFDTYLWYKGMCVVRWPYGSRSWREIILNLRGVFWGYD